MSLQDVAKPNKISPDRVVNVNLGVMGHIDSGKTSLARALSSHTSTASMDKHPQSQERGITLDLGFSAFFTDVPDRLKDPSFDLLQYTLVDCPGHASLIRTIIGGAQIIDMMLLVIDVTKGFQTQTAECLVIGEILSDRMIVVLNKTDKLPAEKRGAMIDKMKTRVLKTLQPTKFADSTVVAVSANPEDGTSCVDELLTALSREVKLPSRDVSGDFLFAIDHCFMIKGQGTVMTGTVLNGSTEVNKTIELPEHKMEKKIKSMQMFRRPVTKVKQGDRVGICVPSLDPKLIERGIASDVGTVPTFQSVIACVKKIRFYKGDVLSKQKFHVSIGHVTVMANLAAVFTPVDDIRQSMEGLTVSGSSQSQTPLQEFGQKYVQDAEYYYQDSLTLPNSDDTGIPNPSGLQFVYLEFEHPVTCPYTSVIIGSKLDADVNTSSCRLAFYGVVNQKMVATDKQGLRVFKRKSKEGVVDRVVDDTTVIVKHLVKKETDVTIFLGLKVETEEGAMGVIESSFGKSGKLKCVFSDPVELKAGSKIILRFKKYMWQTNKKLIQ
eukprot:GFYU01008920.1.p1 GENE.GFYU01008920.1~~GFYU01008920.1.p1  ORF type:complete len:551 (-),score=131.98 GFYU01008920.1:16-1668(-)